MSMTNSKLATVFLTAVRNSGTSAYLISNASDEPLKILLYGPDDTPYEIWLYIKRLTEGGRNDKDEYRIQLNSNLIPFAFNPKGQTLLLGYYPQRKLFVGFDPKTVSKTSNTRISAGYVSISKAKKALRRGMTFDINKKGYLAVGIRPSLLVSYCMNSAEIHESKDYVSVIDALDIATRIKTTSNRNQFFTKKLGEVPEERKRLLRRIFTYARDSGFGDRVRKAYDNSCALTGSQMRIIDAAHILPVCNPGSSDKTSNGILLSPNLHRAFDSALIYLTTDYDIKLNERKAHELNMNGLGSGLVEIGELLGKIKLPTAEKDRPDRTMIEKANTLRDIPI